MQRWVCLTILFLTFTLPVWAQQSATTLSTEEIQHILSAAVAKANEIGVPMGISVVDAGGNLLGFIKMDGAFIHTNHTSFSKAYTAASIRKPSGASGIPARGAYSERSS